MLSGHPRRRQRLVHVLSVPDSLLFLEGQVGFMQAHGFDVSVVCSPGEGLEEFRDRNGVDVHEVDMLRKISPARDLSALSKLRSLFRSIRPDIVHAHTPKGGLLGMLAATWQEVPIRIYGMRGLPMQTAEGWRRYLLRMTEHVSCACAHRVICESHSLRRFAITEHLGDPMKMDVLMDGSATGVDSSGRFNPSSIPLESRQCVRHELGIPPDSFVVGFVGRLVRDKGIAELASAWRTIEKAVPGARLIVVGAFEPRDPVSLEDQRFLESNRSIHLTGFRRDLPQLYAAMDVVALPSYREGFPNVLLEAQAMEKPVVASSVEGFVDAVLDGETGVLVPVRDGNRLAQALLMYASQPQLRLQHGRAGRARVAKLFERTIIWEALLNRYRSLAEGIGGSQSRLPREATSPDSRG